MSLDGGEVLSRVTQQIRKATLDVRASVRELGTGRDAVARDRLRRGRVLAQLCAARVSPVLTTAAAAADGPLAPMVEQYATARAEYDAADVDALRRERQTFRQFDGPATAEDTGDGDGGALATVPLLQQHRQQPQVRAQDIRPVDLSEFRTEEAIQREKLQCAREIESDVMDLRTTYQEFHSLVSQQQEGLDVVTANVTHSNNYVEQGHGQLVYASRHQKRCRKIGCVLGIVLALVIIAVIIVAVVATR